ncbi:MAG: TIGR01244 family sulfur transferase [Gammaproteobacteria bacterium]
MKITNLDKQVSVSDQITVSDLNELSTAGVEILVCNRPDKESAEQTDFNEIETAAKALGMEAIHIPFTAGKMTEEQQKQFSDLLNSGKTVHAYCRTGNRSSNIWNAVNSEVQNVSENDSVSSAEGVTPNQQNSSGKPSYDVVVVGAGSGGIAVSSSLLKRNPSLRIAIVDPSTEHFYQPGWTMVGGGIFDANTTRKETRNLIPNGVKWIQQSVTEFSPENNKVQLSDNSELYYHQLVVSPGLKLNWSGIEGLEETLGKNGVTSNYRYDLAPYTWQLVQNLRSGKALFTQPPMPIKCAASPQKALYLSADHWHKKGLINDIDINFHNAGGVLFGVEAYVPALMSYMQKYQTNIHFMQTLTKVDGEQKKAWFKSKDEEGNDQITTSDFDMIHVCPPQCAPDFIRESELSDDAGWLDVDQNTLQHKKYANIWGLGDVMNTPNAKTMAAVRKQAPVVAQNISDTMLSKKPGAGYDGYGSCPLTVEAGKIVLAEFAYGGKLAPTFPEWVIDGTKPTKLAWILKSKILPAIYWHGMLKGREWLASPLKNQS